MTSFVHLGFEILYLLIDLADFCAIVWIPAGIWYINSTSLTAHKSIRSALLALLSAPSQLFPHFLPFLGQSLGRWREAGILLLRMSAGQPARRSPLWSGVGLRLGFSHFREGTPLPNLRRRGALEPAQSFHARTR